MRIVGRGAVAHELLRDQDAVAGADEHVTALAGRPLIGPQPGTGPVADTHRDWHNRQVFHGTSRPAAAT